MNVEHLIQEAKMRNDKKGPDVIRMLVEMGARFRGPQGDQDLLGRSWYYGPIMLSHSHWIASRRLADVFAYMAGDSLLRVACAQMFDSRAARIIACLNECQRSQAEDPR